MDGRRGRVTVRLHTNPAFAAHLHALYREETARGLRINTYPLPEDGVPALLASPA